MILHGKYITLEQSYEISVAARSYKNLVIACDLDVRTDILKRGALLYEFGEYTCHEYFNILQCTKCQRFGHLLRECKSLSVCRICADYHDTKSCNGDNIQVKCAYCVRENANGSEYNDSHKASDDRCPVRKDRINSLKLFHLSKNDN